MSSGPATSVRRLMAFAIDWIILAFWGGALFGVVAIATNGKPPQPASPWQAQLIGLVAMTIPFMLYFAVCESSSMRASVGKRILGLSVSTETGERLPFSSAVARNTIKFLPWECGHIVAHQAVFSGEAGFATWVWGPAAVAFLCPAWWIVAIILTERAPYYRWTSARVERSTDAQASKSRVLAAQQDAAANNRPQAGDRS